MRQSQNRSRDFRADTVISKVYEFMSDCKIYQNF